ncbi:MAG: sensor histidine kinase [Actinomycetales bacterium]
MGPRIWGRASVSYAFGLSLAFLGLVAGLLVFVIMSFWPFPSPVGRDWYAYGLYLACVSHIGSGLLLWWFRPTNRLGPLLVAVGCVWLLVGLDTSSNMTVAGFGFIFASAPAAIVWHILLAFPNGQLQTRWARAVVFANWFSHVVLWVPQWLYNPGTPWAIGDNLHIAHTWHNIELYVVTIPLSIVGVAILVSRIRRTDARVRWVLWPLHGYGVFAAFAVPVTYDVLGPDLGLDATTVTGIQLYTVAIVPIFFAAAALSPAFGRMGQVDELAARLGQRARSERDLQQELSRTLGDPTLQLLFWLDDAGRYVNAEDAVVELPAPDDDERGVVPIDVADRRVGAIVYNRVLIAEPAPVEAAAQVVALSVDRERLLADLRASEDALRQSRTRIVEAGDAERRRFARSLHDSVQGQLVLLGLQARSLADDPAAPKSVRAEALALWSGIDAAASDLRQQVHTVMPAALLERGLVAAIEDYVDRMPAHTTLTVGDLSDHLPTVVQTTAYFIVVESLTNAMKYAHASRISVVLDETEAGLVVTVEDDGVGGAGTAGGSGLSGLSDRAEALGGRLTFESVAGCGTRLTAVLPSEPVGSARR